MVVFESVSGQMKISLLSSDFLLFDEHITADKLYGFDIEFRNGTLFFTGFTAVWKMAVDSNGLSEPERFHEAVNPKGANGTNGIAVHDGGVLIANNNFIYSYVLNGDEVAALYRIDVEKDIDALVVYKDFLIVSYMDNIGIRIYKISDLVG